MVVVVAPPGDGRRLESDNGGRNFTSSESMFVFSLKHRTKLMLFWSFLGPKCRERKGRLFFLFSLEQAVCYELNECSVALRT